MEYFYVREKIIDKYDINNIDRVNTGENLIRLAKEIEIQINKKFKIICNNLECKIIFDIELTVQEKTLLDTIVNDHKNNN